LSIREITAAHPCFALGKPNNKGRIHLPVSPGCNISCKFCDRQINTTEQRPGVTGTIITPVEAIDAVRRALALVPEITVVGIAGPGDTLATPYAIETFRLVGREFPHLIKCMSTNGLLLPDKADEVIDVAIDTLSVTVNDVYPETLLSICDHIVFNGEIVKGIDGAKLLIENQIEGIRRVTGAGVTVKVNTVLIPGVNASHIGEIAATVKRAGAEIYNIIPLIPQFELAHCDAPSCAEIDVARTAAEKHIKVFRHCQHCRADAVGVPGVNDFAEQIYLKRLNVKDTFSHG